MKPQFPPNMTARFESIEERLEEIEGYLNKTGEDYPDWSRSMLVYENANKVGKIRDALKELKELQAEYFLFDLEKWQNRK